MEDGDGYLVVLLPNEVPMDGALLELELAAAATGAGLAAPGRGRGSQDSGDGSQGVLLPGGLMEALLAGPVGLDAGGADEVRVVTPTHAIASKAHSDASSHPRRSLVQ
jgi:hypothetical protein